ncbi:MAG: hypothetical protein DLM59_04455 [Pseudonocardiales bacterium]|nr:MAG: hypothetical protein DLM59_04455 [Pseudonocardiales bacterium]
MVADSLIQDGLSASAHQLDITDPASVVRAMADIGFTHGRTREQHGHGHQMGTGSAAYRVSKAA